MGPKENGIKFLRGDSFIVRASCSADPDKRVHSISVMDPGFPVCVCGGGGGEQITHAHVLLPLGYGGAAVSSSIGSREEHIISTHISTSQRVAYAYSICTQIKPIT